MQASDDASLDAPDPARLELLAELSGQASDHRQRITALLAEKLDLQERISTLKSEELLGPQADAWGERLQDVRLEIVRLREQLNAVLDQIADLSRP